jgi:hypothetical protein
LPLWLTGINGSRTRRFPSFPYWKKDGRANLSCYPTWQRGPPAAVI